jgi:antitoxin Phd
VTKHGKPAAVVLSASEFARLKRIEKTKKPSFKDFLLSMPRGDIEFPRAKIKPRDVEF